MRAASQMLCQELFSQAPHIHILPAQEEPSHRKSGRITSVQVQDFSEAWCPEHDWPFFQLLMYVDMPTNDVLGEKYRILRDAQCAN